MSEAGQKIWVFLKQQGAIFVALFLYDPFWPKIKAFFTLPRFKRARLVVGITMVTVVVAVLIFPPGLAAAKWYDSIIWAFGAILWIVAAVLALILVALGWAFNYVITGGPFQQVISHEAVRIGWTAVRDICNLVFVLILLGIGFATILRVPTYHVKKLIVPFIVALLLINFSKLICGVITDFTHVIMASFAAAMTGGTNYSGTIASGIGVEKWLLEPGISDDKSGTASDYVQGLLIMIIFMIALIFSFLLIVVLLVVRWITLMVLTIFSPIVYAAQILPTTRSFAKKWWQQFLQNAFYGPAVVFMVYLAIVIVRNSVQGKIESPAGPGGPNVITPETLLALIIACVILYKAVTMAKSMGIAGASAVISTGTKWGKGALGAVGGGLAGLTGLAALGTGVKQAFKTRKDLVQQARKERGERWGAGLAQKTTWGEANKQAQAKQEQLLADREKQTATRMQTGQMNPSDLKKKLKSGTKEEQLVAATELAKRGELDRGDYNKISSYGGLSRTGKAALSDVMTASDPMAGVNMTLLNSGDVDERKKLDNIVKRADLKKISSGAIASADSRELLDTVAKIRGKDALVSMHKDLDEPTKKIMGKVLADSASPGQGTRDPETYKNLVGASLAANKALPFDAGGYLNLTDDQLKETVQTADAKDLSVALLRPEAIGTMDSSQENVIAKSLTLGKLKQMGDVMGSDSKYDALIRSKRQAHAIGGTPFDNAMLRSLNKDLVLREYGK